MLLIPDELICNILRDAEEEMKRGLDKVHKRHGTEDGMRQANRSIA